MNFCFNKNIGVVGYGSTGQAIIRTLEQLKANIFLFDDKIIDSPYYTKPETCNWSKIDYLVVSPGIHLWWDTNSTIRYARKCFVPIINDIDIFQTMVDKPIVAVTGTNGKSTTTALIHHIFNLEYNNVVIGGNFGTPVAKFPLDAKYYVIELSSYQLESCNMLGFDTSILLNITPDHLTRHGGMPGYIASKQKIFANPKPNSIAIVGIDDPYSQHMLDFVYYPHIIYISGVIVPDAGIGWKDDKLIDNRNNDRRIICNAIEHLDGSHNRQNIAAAYATCISNNISVDTFLKGLHSFKGLEHRQEIVATINGVRYINDSKATNTDSVEQALRRFNNIIWILGGRPKEDGIESLVPYFSKIKFAYLIGEAANAWHKLLDIHHVNNEIVYTLDQAVTHSYRKATAGDTVLLSPACASFDQFKSFEDRGDKFKKLIRDLLC